MFDWAEGGNEVCRLQEDMDNDDVITNFVTS